MNTSDRLIRRLASAQRVAVLTGAGMSAESGVPTFRDPDGLWARFRPEELASMDAFLANPGMVQAWYAHRREIVHHVEPNPGHRALVHLETLIPEFCLITQNVDDLHSVAGSSHVLELHGNLTRNYCVLCFRQATDADLAGGSCAACGGLVRPDVVWFGEMLPDGVFESAHKAAVQADVFLSIGTSAVVYPAAGLPQMASAAGAYCVELNLEPSAIADSMDQVILGPAGRTLPELVAAVAAAVAG